jgi:putative ABC transport system permease protein
MTSLQRKLWRELWQIRGQAIAIALVLIGGVAVCIMCLSTYNSLRLARDNYYRDHHFGQVFLGLKRAPLSVMQQVLALEGVTSAQARVVAPANLSLAQFNEPIQGLVQSIPDHPQQGNAALNQLYVVSGRLPDPEQANEVVISEGFALAHDIQAGHNIQAVINGRQQRLRIVGVVLSPEHIYQIAPGAVFPDYLRFAVLWMPYRPLAKAFDMDGAFNDLVVQQGVVRSVGQQQLDLSPNTIKSQAQALEQNLIRQLDHLFVEHGGLGAFNRDDQISNRFLREEFGQLRMLAILFPCIFLSVAIFLLQVVITRLINTQRELIAVLKAFGYSNGQIFWHYSQMILVITLIGISLGFVVGYWLGIGMTGIYNQFYRFPELIYQPPPELFFIVAIATSGTAVLATARSVHRSTALPPAEAMRPAAPEHFQHRWWERLGLEHYLGAADKMIVRQLTRKPGKSFFSLIGLAMACGILMVGNFQQDAVDYMIHVQFKLTQKQDIEVTFNEAVAEKTLYSLRRLVGVEYVEGYRSVPARIRFQQRSYRTSLQGLPEQRTLQAVLDTQLQDTQLPYEGLLVTAHLAEKLGFAAGDWVEVDILEGQRVSLPIQVTQLSQQFLGTGVYLRQDLLNRLMNEGPAINGAMLNIDESQAQTVYEALRAMPQVAGINLRQTVIDSLNDSLERVLLFFTFINAVLGCVIAFGVVYNTVRIALAERGRELASLRVLGYSHGEVAYILLGELALLILISLPLGFVIGRYLCHIIANNLQSDLYRIPLVLSPFTYSFAAFMVLLAALFSTIVVVRRLWQLDLVEVLKTRE